MHKLGKADHLQNELHVDEVALAVVVRYFLPKFLEHHMIYPVIY